MISSALDSVGLNPSDTLGRFPHQLSGGQRQRLMLARCLLCKPEIIIADEPVSMVDASLRASILDLMLRLKEENGISVAKFVIHYEDNTQEEKPIIFGDDLLGWMHVSQSSSVKSESVGWIGPNNLGNRRILTKPVWNNPFPEKVISHIDFISELKAAAPFVVGITLE